MRAGLPLSLLVLTLAAGAATPDTPTAGFAIATDNPEATRVGYDVLRRGGTAADAAAAALLALGVASPGSSGFGGGGFALHRSGRDGQITFLDFRERAPAAATATMFEDREREAPGSRPSQVGGLSVAVPGEPMGVATLVRRFGRLPLRTVVAPAARLARRGVVPTEYVRGMLSPELRTALRADRALRGWFRPDGALRGRLPQPGLASVLSQFGRLGPDVVYRGAVGRAMVEDIRRQGGVMTMQDLADYAVRERVPLRETHFGHTFVTAPPESAGGLTLLSVLDFLERVGVGPTSTDDEVRHAMLEAFKGPYLDRQAAFGDPDHVEVPVDRLADPARRAARAARFDPRRATAASAYALPFEADAGARTPDGGGTSHLCVVDAEGNAVSVTSTINLGYGARFTAGSVLMNDEMDDFARAVGVANAFGLVGGARNLPGPGRRPVSSMSPTLVLGADGRLELCVGAAGGSRIPTATVQVAFDRLVRGASSLEAVSRPRVHHQAVPDVAYSERRVPLSPESLVALSSRGHGLDLLDNVAIVQLVAVRPDGSLDAAADPRKGGLALGR